MSRPRLLDLFCGAGGAAMGYHRAGFDVVGVDIKPQPRYPFEFIHEGALEVMEVLLAGEDWCTALRNFGLADFAAVHASPPCQEHIRGGNRSENGTGWLLGATRDALEASGLPWVIENVPGAPMRVDYKLCGCMFGLPRLKRERWFETSWRGFDMRPPCQHRQPVVSLTGTSAWKGRGPHISVNDWREAIGIDWMSLPELSQAIPPAYTEYIGRQLLDVLERAA